MVKHIKYIFRRHAKVYFTLYTGTQVIDSLNGGCIPFDVLFQPQRLTILTAVFACCSISPRHFMLLAIFSKSFWVVEIWVVCVWSCSVVGRWFKKYSSVSTSCCVQWVQSLSGGLGLPVVASPWGGCAHWVYTWSRISLVLVIYHGEESKYGVCPVL